MTSSPDPTDVELGRLRDGYPALAGWIARDPDSETFIFRKFDRLAARNILHLQAKLTAIENEMDKLDEEARQSNDFEACQSSRRWESLTKNAEVKNRPEKKRIEVLDELREGLREYCSSHVVLAFIFRF
jgi:hypothetical protein